MNCMRNPRCCSTHATYVCVRKFLRMSIIRQCEIFKILGAKHLPGLFCTFLSRSLKKNSVITIEIYVLLLLRFSREKINWTCLLDRKTFNMSAPPFGVDTSKKKVVFCRERKRRKLFGQFADQLPSPILSLLKEETSSSDDKVEKFHSPSSPLSLWPAHI